MTKKETEFWSHVQWLNDDNNTVQITRDFIEQGMSIDEVVIDWMEHGDLCEIIHAI